MTERASRDIPFGPQFSPEQTALPILLDLLVAEGGAGEARLKAAIERAFFSEGEASAYNRTKKADNTLLALRDYGILADDKMTLTALGVRLVELRRDEESLYEEFAKHILLNRNGLMFVRTVQDLLASNAEVSLTTIPKALRLRGINVPPTTTHLSAMKGWLKMAGVFTGGRQSYDVDDRRLKELLGGLDAKDLDALADLNPIQRAFLRALARFPAGEWAASNDVAKLAEQLYGVEFPWKSIADSVLAACAEAGFVRWEKATEGRGAKPHLVRPTAKYQVEVLESLLARYSDKISSRLRDLLRTPLAKIVQDLEHDSKNVKGKALELLALYLMFTLDLEFVDWRKRGKQTGGAEVDVLVESARLIFSRWQIQCKNGRATLEDVAKEVGLAYHLNSNVILVLSTQRVSRDAYAYAESIMRKSNLQVIVLAKGELNRIMSSPAGLVDVLLGHSQYTMQVKRLTEDQEEAVNGEVE